MEELKAADVPEADIGIVQGDKILLVKGLGIANVETGVTHTAPQVRSERLRDDL